MPPGSYLPLPPLTSPSHPPQPSAEAAREPKRRALEPPVDNHTRSTSPRHHANSTRSRPSQRPQTRERTPGVFQNFRNERGEGSQDQIAALAGWSPDALNHIFTSSPQADNDAPFLNDIADNEFSSPSNYPSFATSTGDQTLAADLPVSFLPRPGTHAFSRTTSGASTSTNTTSTASRILHDLDIMPPTRRSLSSLDGHSIRQQREPSEDEDRTPKRRRRETPIAGVDDWDPFMNSSPVKDEDLIDLTADDGKADLDKMKKESEKEKEDRGDIVKLSAFQCVICMDDCTNLTATHCGHLYCAECIQSSLNISTTRGSCPMCRSKIDLKPRDQYTSKTKGLYTLELKVMTKTKSGKKKVKLMV